QQRALSLGQQVIAPVEGGRQGRLALGGGTRPRWQQGEAILQAGGDLSRIECPCAGGRELDGERQSVQTPTDVKHILGVGATEPELRPGLPRAVAEQLYRVVFAKWRDCPGHLAVDAQRLPAGGDDL